MFVFVVSVGLVFPQVFSLNSTQVKPSSVALPSLAMAIPGNRSIRKLVIVLMLVWLVLSDEQLSKSWPFSLLNDEQRVATGWGLSTCQLSGLIANPL